MPGVNFGQSRVHNAGAKVTHTHTHTPVHCLRAHSTGRQPWAGCTSGPFNLNAAVKSQSFMQPYSSTAL